MPYSKQRRTSPKPLLLNDSQKTRTLQRQPVLVRRNGCPMEGPRPILCQVQRNSLTRDIAIVVKVIRYPADTPVEITLDLMLPHYHHAPTSAPKPLVITPVPPPIQLDFLTPEWRKLVPPPPVSKPMPEITINKNCELGGLENNVRAPGEVSSVQRKTKSSAMQRRSEQQLGTSVCAVYA